MSEPEAPAESEKRARAEAIDTRLVRRLADILKDTGLSEIEVERHGLRIRVARETTVVAAGPAMQYAPMPMVAPPSAQPGPGAASQSSAITAAASSPAEPEGEKVTSPMVGTVYLQAQPGSPQFVRVGDTVSEGQTLLIVEAMKTMNPIAAPKAGVVTALLVADGQPVEYGEPLAVIG